METDWLTFAERNFSVAVALFVLIRIEPQLRKLTEAIHELRGAIIGGRRHDDNPNE